MARATSFRMFWEQYKNQIPEIERADFVSAYYKRLTSQNREERLSAARAWSTWEGATSRLIPDPAMIQNSGEDEFAEAFCAHRMPLFL